ncbi:MAG: DAK2 domain-containing protein [Chloroflexi bacterium]|nr:DAK2 domain-containing protein [Chloroflexota bacterium]
MTDPAHSVESLGGPQLREMFAAATAWLEVNSEQVNAVNVFPVPDGDTGTNMLLTMRSTMREADSCQDEGAGAMLAAMSHGALMGARGNSGVILSQIVSGMASAIGSAARLDSSLFAAALESASTAAYKAVTKPAEGTILTVIREVAEAVRQASNGGSPDVESSLEIAVETAKASVERTPTLLPVLAEAGVVDAGGLGLQVLFEGMLRHLRGEPADVPSAAGAVEEQWLSMTDERHATEESAYGYCTEVLIGGDRLEIQPVRERIETLGDSVLVVGDQTLVRVHVHTDDPGAVLSLGTEIGSLRQVKVDNIREQAERFVREQSEALARDVTPVPPVIGSLSCVVVVAGDGMASVFGSVGGTRIVSGGPTMNPSTQEIVDAIEACPTDDVVVLPNDKNVVLAAQQATKLASKRVRVVQSRSVPQGIAAALAINPDDSFDDNARAMESAIEAVQTVEVTKAVRSTTIGGVDVREGQAIAIVDDELTTAAESAEDAAIQALTEAVGDDTSLICIYYGGDRTKSDANKLGKLAQAAFESHEIEIVFGGQPHYDYIISVE